MTSYADETNTVNDNSPSHLGYFHYMIDYFI